MDRVYIRHIRALGYCASGTRQWFAKHNIDWNSFLENGATFVELEGTGDELAFRAVAKAREEYGIEA